MTIFRSFVLVLIYLGTAAVAVAATTCTFTNTPKTMVLIANCTTDTAILVPDGKTLDGNGFTITGVDPAGDHFKGAVIRNGGETAHVTNLRVTVSNLANVCDPGSPVDTRLRGILFQGASGSITNSTVININQGASGCQEGNAIEVRNFGDNESTSRVTVDGNNVSRYQKTGIVANGDVDVTITDNVLTVASLLITLPETAFRSGSAGPGL